MKQMIDYVKHELMLLKSKEEKIKTKDVRKLSSRVYQSIKNESFEHKLELCERMLEERTWALGVIAYDIAFREREHYTHDTFEVFETWLIKYVTGWGDCDDFCTHAFGALLAKYNDLFDKVILWCDRPEFWVRRAAAVILIYPMRKNLDNGLQPFMISNQLMNDENHLVLKGYGWMLKIYSENNPKAVEKYLRENVNEMPRVSFRYALEKLDKETKSKLMKL